MPNTELLVDVLTEIELHPDAWDQSEWAQLESETQPPEGACGTAFCMAGWACHLSGYRPHWFPAAGSGWRSTSMVTPSGSLLIPDAARAAFGIPSAYTDDDKHWLFDGDNTLDDLYRISAELFGLPEPELRARVRQQVDECRALATESLTRRTASV